MCFDSSTSYKPRLCYDNRPLEGLRQDDKKKINNHNEQCFLQDQPDNMDSKAPDNSNVNRSTVHIRSEATDDFVIPEVVCKDSPTEEQSLPPQSWLMAKHSN